MSKAVFCYCKNTYSIECKDKECDAPKYWKQGIGDISNQGNNNNNNNNNNN